MLLRWEKRVTSELAHVSAMCAAVVVPGRVMAYATKARRGAWYAQLVGGGDQRITAHASRQDAMADCERRAETFRVYRVPGNVSFSEDSKLPGG